MLKLRQTCRDGDKFDSKIVNKKFLLGKYFDGKRRPPLKAKKFDRSKFADLLDIQSQLSSQARTYGFFLPLHHLWQAYLHDLLKDQKSEEGAQLKILRADFHGCSLQVAHSRIESYIGIEGIVVLETLRTLKIVTPKDKIVTLLKKQVIFTMTAGGRDFVVNGNALMFRPSERIRHKFKPRKISRVNQEFIDMFLN